ncbi:MAG: tRNA 5-methoxyuridine(34)/uridine 5-oxyacetic acid(34) synthase CmoB [Proteobacteria bacterium]|nr:tRNA 5-methoxyuridine(34)/uridine 5-oxyacetic acid(34) synthase CmoB [Pseudomonadota bacterium]
MLDLYTSLWQQLNDLNFKPEDIQRLIKQTEKILLKPIAGDYPRWFEAYSSLPNIDNIECPKNKQAITCASNQDIPVQLKFAYQQLIPWRKGPFSMFDTYIDAEWQSNLKWYRIAKYLPKIENKLVLDVGCGNGYYMFQMAEQKPLLLLGIDPGLLQVMQFWSIDRYRQSRAYVLPLAMQKMPTAMNKFDLTLSMGVLYHRKSPIQHIKELAESLKTGGHLLIETLVIDGDATRCLMPTDRYAQMRNVWFLPSVEMLTIMLQRTGFTNIQCIDVTTTTIQEQRTTRWMKFHSLKEFLNKTQSKTIEGYDLPKRATLIAEKK